MSERERLVRLLLSLMVELGDMAGDPTPADYEIADAILASDWLAEHDAEVAKAARAEAWEEGYTAANTFEDTNPYLEWRGSHG